MLTSISTTSGCRRRDRGRPPPRRSPPRRPARCPPPSRAAAARPARNAAWSSATSTRMPLAPGSGSRSLMRRPVPAAAARAPRVPPSGRRSTATLAADLRGALLHRLEARCRAAAPRRSPRAVVGHLDRRAGVSARERDPAGARARRGGRALVIASTAIRYAATSTAAGSSGSGRRARPTTRVVEPGAPSSRRDPGAPPAGRSRRPARARRAPAGGGRPRAAGRRRAPRAPPRRARRSWRRAASGSVVEHRRGGLGAHPDGRERRPQAVVEVAAQPAALLLAGEHEALARPDEVVAQPHRPDRRARLAAEVLEQRRARPSRKPRSPDSHARGRAGRRARRRGRSAR